MEDNEEVKMWEVGWVVRQERVELTVVDRRGAGVDRTGDGVERREAEVELVNRVRWEMVGENLRVGMMEEEEV